MKITVVGLGYVGAVAAAGLAKAGHDLLGVDIDRNRVRLLQAGRVPAYEPGLEPMVAAGISQGNLRFRHRDDVSEPLGDVALIATGTPPTESGAAYLRQVKSAVSWVISKSPQRLVVVMKSTVPPGTGQRIVQKELKGTGLRYVSNPEFLREGRAIEDWGSPDRIVIGAEPGDASSVAVVREMHAGIEAPCLITDISSAEMIKYASNAFLATRVSFINEVASLCDRVADVRAYDPEANETARPHLPPSVRVVDDPVETGDRAQAMVVMTEWRQIVAADWKDIARCMRPPRFLFDGRNALDAGEMRRLGFEYKGIGREADGTPLPPTVHSSFPRKRESTRSPSTSGN